MAFRLLNAIGVEPGGFMAALAREHAAWLPQSPSGMGSVTVSYVLTPLEAGQKSLFGPFWRRRALPRTFLKRPWPGRQAITSAT